MAKEICISSTPHETRLAILEDDLLTEIYYERENEYTLAGSIYKGRVTRVLPGMQSAFVDLGLERDAFLYVTDFMEEQEDSADFEKVPNGNGGRSREGQSGREPREAQAGRESRENRPSRSGPSIEGDTRAVAGVDTRGASPNASGEAATGDDDQQGTRRWRGRRGRRRGGRPHGPRETGQVSAQPRGAGDPTSGIEIEVETGPTVYEETVAHGGSEAAFSETPTPSHSSLAREDTPSARAVSVSTPIVLPGESLSRYGAKPTETAPRTEARAASAPVASGIAYKPSTLVEVVPNWDGGAELPGESLSRHRGKPASTPPAAKPGEPTSVMEAQVVTAEPEAMVEHEAQAAGIEETAQHAHAGEISAEPAVAAGFSTPEHHAEPVTHHEAIAEPAAEIEEHAHEEAVFEPEHASASYRVDPAAPSEYRLSAVIEEEEEAAIPVLAAEIEPTVAGHSVDEG